jgi:predicted aspartyl protease
MCFGELNSFKLNLLVDTGASMTVMDINRIKMICPDCKLNTYNQPFTGIGSSNVQTFSTKLTRYTLGDYELKNPEILLIDMSMLNKAYASYDLDRIDGVLGGDFLLSHGARIDYELLIMEISK